jgi:V8-like Glu-specific endopeptidase
MMWRGLSREQISAADLFARDLFGFDGRPRRRWPARLGPPGVAMRQYGREDAEDAEDLEDLEADEGWLQERVQGPDNRAQVLAQCHNPSTTLFPFNTICHMDQGTVNATGTLIAPRVVLTAGHVVKGLTSVVVTPGANFPAPFEPDRRPALPRSQTAASTTFRFHPTLDLALVLLPARFTRPCQFMMLQPRGKVNTATLLTIAGYPRVAPTPGAAPLPGSMWRHSDRLQVTGVTDTHLTYQIDTTVGQSGSPLWLLGDHCIRLLLGVHISGTSASNRGVRITCAVIDWIEATCRAASITPLPIVDAVQRRRCPAAAST